MFIERILQKLIKSSNRSRIVRESDFITCKVKSEKIRSRSLIVPRDIAEKFTSRRRVTRDSRYTYAYIYIHD